MGELRAQWSAGWRTALGEVVTYVQVNGPKSFQFEVTPPAGRTVMFRGVHEATMAIYQAGLPVSEGMSSEEVVELLVVGGARGEYISAAHLDQGGDRCETTRYDVCLSLANRIVSLTEHDPALPRFPKCPQWQPAWRVNELENPPVPVARRAGQNSRARLAGVAS